MSQEAAPVSMIDIVRGLKPVNLPSVLCQFDLRRPSICVPVEHEKNHKEYSELIPTLGLAYLSRALDDHCIALQLNCYVPIHVSKLSKKILSDEILASIAFYWLSNESGDMSKSAKEHRRFASRLLAYFHDLYASSGDDFHTAFEAIFPPLIDHLADRDDYKLFGLGVPSDVWVSYLAKAQRRKRAQTQCDDREEPAHKRVRADPASASTQGETLGQIASSIARASSINRRSVRYLSPTSVRNPSTEVFHKIVAASTSAISCDIAKESPATTLSEPTSKSLEAGEVASEASCVPIPKEEVDDRTSRSCASSEGSILRSVKSWLTFKH
ncbi:hypothetical protein EV121DRAFT_293678 [Schizophyllum commune]